MPRAYLAFTADTYKPALWLALVNLSNVSVIIIIIIIDQSKMNHLFSSLLAFSATGLPPSPDRN